MPRSKKDAVEADETPVIDAIDEPKPDIVIESAPGVGKTEVKTADEGVAELKKRLEASEESQRRLERERNEAVSRAYRADNETQDTNLRLIESAIGQITANSAILEGNYAYALSQGDNIAAAKIAREMAANEAKALQLENGKLSLKERPKEQPRPLDPVEAFISNANLGPRPAAWIRAHPEYATNQRLTQKMIAADTVADGDGFERGTDDYFARVEEILKINQRAPTRAVQDDEGEPTYSDASRPTSGRQTAPSAIPVSRDVSTSGTRQRTIRLSAAEAEAAEMSGITHEEYARNRDSMRADRGRMN